MDWNSLNTSTKHTLVIIMMRAMRPIQLTGSSVIVMSIETFLRVFMIINSIIVNSTSYNKLFRALFRN